MFDTRKRSHGYGFYCTMYLGAGAIGPILYAAMGDVWSVSVVFLALSLVSLAIVPLTGLYYLSRTAIVSLSEEHMFEEKVL